MRQQIHRFLIGGVICAPIGFLVRAAYENYKWNNLRIQEMRIRGGIYDDDYGSAFSSK